MNHIITFKPNGEAVCLWTDTLPLAQLGSLKVERASTIEFSNDTSLWEVRLGDNPAVVFSAPTRQACINWEIRTINEQLSQEVFV